MSTNLRLKDLAFVAFCSLGGNYMGPFLGNDDYSHAFERSFFQLIPLALIAVIWWIRYRENRIQVHPDSEIAEG
jgi:hypothetical protein